MQIVIDRGNERKVYSIPCGSIISQLAKEEPRDYKAFLYNVCSLFGIECLEVPFYTTPLFIFPYS